MAFSTDMGIAEVQAGLREGDFTAREVAQESLAHVKAADEKVHAFLELTEEAAYAAADRVDAAIAAGSFDELGPLAGMAVVSLVALAFFKESRDMDYER